MILCGGIGYRLKEETEFRPKPMVEVGGKPILWHILKIYSHFGFNNFIIALGYKGNLIKDYFVNQKYYDHDFTVDTSTRKLFHNSNTRLRDKMRITFVDTGIDSLTGERVRRIKKYIDSDTFMVTYGDGVADINIKSLVQFHKSKQVISTVTGVYPKLRYGGFDTDKNGLASNFETKAIIRHTINGGFMVFNKRVFDYIKPDSMIEEIYDPLVKKKQVAIFSHKGFWHAMDTIQDMNELNDMWKANPAWKVWK